MINEWLEIIGFGFQPFQDYYIITYQIRGGQGPGYPEKTPSGERPDD